MLVVSGCEQMRREADQEMAKEATKSMETMSNELAAQQIKSYELSVKSGDKMEICVQAGLVAVFFNEAHNEAEYLKWKKIEKRDCKKAGL